MPPITWDRPEERRFETGVDHGVLYIPDATGVYANGVAWNGLVNVTESPSGAEPSPQYADNMKYLNLRSAEEFGATLEVFTAPKEFEQFDGFAELVPSVTVAQQSRRMFGLSYRTRVGNALESTDFGYKLHLVYGAEANPSEKAFGTINDTPEASTFSYDLTTTPVAVGDGFKPTSLVVVDSTEVAEAALLALEAILYGAEAATPRLPLPAEIADILAA